MPIRDVSLVLSAPGAAHVTKATLPESRTQVAGRRQGSYRILPSRFLSTTPGEAMRSLAQVQGEAAQLPQGQSDKEPKVADTRPVFSLLPHSASQGLTSVA